MEFFKYINEEGFILYIGIGVGQTPITEDEYKLIEEAITSKPEDTATETYMLQNDTLAWIPVEIEIEEEETEVE